MPLIKKKKTEPAEPAAAEKADAPTEKHRDAVSPSERAMIEAVSGTPAHTEPKPVKAPSAKYSYLNAPIVKSRPCPLCGEFLEADTIFCPKCNNRVASRYDEALILRRQGKVPVKKADEKKPEPTAPKKTEAPVAEKKPEPTAPKKTEAPVAEKKPEPTAPKKAEAPVAEKKPELTAPKKAEAPVAEKKPEPAAPKKAEAPVAEKKPEPTAPKKAEAPVAEKKPEPTASKKAEAPVAEKKPEPAAPKKAEAPIAEKKHEPKISKAPANLVIKVKGSYTKPVMNPHFTAADDFDD